MEVLNNKKQAVVSVTGIQIVTSFFEANIMVFNSSLDSYSEESLVSRSFTSRGQEKNATSKDKVTLHTACMPSRGN